MSDRKSEIIPTRPGTVARPEDVIGRTVTEISLRCGTYGMGGPGFAGFELGPDAWLILTLWGAAEWLNLDGRPIEAMRHEPGGVNARFDPIISDAVQFGRDRTTTPAECLAAALPVPAEITEFAFSGHAGHMLIGGRRLAILADPAERPVWPGGGQPRALKPGDDLAHAWILAPFPWVRV